MSSATTTSTTTPGIAARLARTNILELAPYRCARDDYNTGILLDANENAFGPPTVGHELVLERYPDPYQIPLKEKVAAYRGHGLQPSNIFVGVGSDEAIDLLMRIFCRPGQDKILTTPPTYGMVGEMYVRSGFDDDDVGGGDDDDDDDGDFDVSNIPCKIAWAILSNICVVALLQYKVSAKVNDIDIVNVPLTPDFDLRIPEVSIGLAFRYMFRLDSCLISKRIIVYSSYVYLVMLCLV